MAKYYNYTFLMFLQGGTTIFHLIFCIYKLNSEQFKYAQLITVEKYTIQTVCQYQELKNSAKF